ncbi:MAG: ComEA family DNA-binding protein [Thermoleophilia bacterium]
MGMPTITRRRAAVYLAVIVVALALGGRYVSTRQVGGGQSVSSRETVAALSVSEPEPAEVVVDVAGAVREPGLYRLPEGSRVHDAIARAGGPTRRASVAGVNLAAPLVDGTQIVVPTRQEANDAQSAAGEAAPGPVRLSTATVEELDALPGVGPVTAQKIVAYREEHGPFRSVDDLDVIPGIGPARLEQLRDLVAP